MIADNHAQRWAWFPDNIVRDAATPASTTMDRLSLRVRPRSRFRGFRAQNDVSADGQRFLGVMPTGSAATDTAEEPVTLRINVILNWFEELQQRVPTGRQ